MNNKISNLVIDEILTVETAEYTDHFEHVKPVLNTGMSISNILGSGPINIISSPYVTRIGDELYLAFTYKTSITEAVETEDDFEKTFTSKHKWNIFVDSISKLPSDLTPQLLADHILAMWEDQVTLLIREGYTAQTQYETDATIVDFRVSLEDLGATRLEEFHKDVNNIENICTVVTFGNRTWSAK
jgi:hypothetical protein